MPVGRGLNLKKNEVIKCIPEDIRRLYEVYSFRNADTVLAHTAPDQFADILYALANFKLTVAMIKAPGGNESGIPKIFSSLLRPRDWFETKIQCDLVIKQGIYKHTSTGKSTERIKTIKKRYVDGHKIDYLKGRIALDLEWNSKDQTFDRDLYAMRAFSECGLIDAGVIITRSQELDDVFTALGLKQKYGASTTWMGKLKYRIHAGRNGGCPILAFGIKKALISDWPDKT